MWERRRTGGSESADQDRMSWQELIKPTRTKRLAFFLAGDVALISLALLLAFELRFEFRIPEYEWPVLRFWLPVLVLVQVAMLLVFKLYSITWVFVGLRELAATVKACLASAAVVFLLNFLLFRVEPNHFLPRSVIILQCVIAMGLIGALRISKRVYHEVIREEKIGSRTLLVGAGRTGERLAREFLRSMGRDYRPVAFVDDDPNKRGTRIHGVPVAGSTNDLPDVVASFRVQTAIIAITAAKHIQVKQWFEQLRAAGVKSVKVVPHITQLPEQSVSVKDIHDLRIVDLLYREPVPTDEARIHGLLAGKRVLVTGAAGSIGSEIARQALLHEPASLAAFDIDETGVHNIVAELRRLQGPRTEVVPYVGDVRNPLTLERLFAAHRPQVVFHAAAYKHVPMMESFPAEALETNVFGTYTLAGVALAHKVERFVNISTDKAVNPTSVMGASKRLAEMICTTFNRLNGTRYVSVRFGNVLGSRGSVVPTFLDQIRQGGPLTVTHPDMQRYFMTIPESVNLVFQAAAMGEGGEVFVLDMGEPVRILKLAEDLVRLNGMEPYDDIPIVITGLRPGEKLFEELLTAEEGTTSTSHAKVFVARNNSKFEAAELEAVLAAMRAATVEGDEAVRAFLREHVPFYAGTLAQVRSEESGVRSEPIAK